MTVTLLQLVPICTALKNNNVSQEIIDEFMPKTIYKKVGKRDKFITTPADWNVIKNNTNITDQNILELIQLAKDWQTKSSKEIFNYKF